METFHFISHYFDDELTRGGTLEVLRDNVGCPPISCGRIPHKAGTKPWSIHGCGTPRPEIAWEH
jgi:hypothetical protein